MTEACAEFTIDALGHSKKRLAPVRCDKRCETCGWNPAEQKRRLETGKFLPVYTRKGIDPETELVIEVTLPEGTKQLVFPKKEEMF